MVVLAKKREARRQFLHGKVWSSKGAVEIDRGEKAAPLSLGLRNLLQTWPLLTLPVRNGTAHSTIEGGPSYRCVVYAFAAVWEKPAWSKDCRTTVGDTENAGGSV